MLYSFQQNIIFCLNLFNFFCSEFHYRQTVCSQTEPLAFTTLSLWKCSQFISWLWRTLYKNFSYLPSSNLCPSPAQWQSTESVNSILEDCILCHISMSFIEFLGTYFWSYIHGQGYLLTTSLTWTYYSLEKHQVQRSSHTNTVTGNVREAT